jgi:hypothetical protein
MSYQIFDSKGSLCKMPDDERAALSPAEESAYVALLDASGKCATAEALCSSLERSLVEITAEIRASESKLARLPRPDRIAETRWALMNS